MLRTRVGTEPYLAPEVKGIFSMDTKQEDLRTYSFAVDIWSIGAITFQMTTSKFPFSDQWQLSNYVVRGSPFPINSLMTQICADFVKSTMARSPGKRPTAQEALSLAWLQQAGQTSMGKVRL